MWCLACETVGAKAALLNAHEIGKSYFFTQLSDLAFLWSESPTDFLVSESFIEDKSTILLATHFYGVFFRNYVFSESYFVSFMQAKVE